MSLTRKPAGMELIDLLDRVLDKGIVVEASSRMHLLGSNAIRQGTHFVVAAIETHMTHGEARAVARVAARLAVASRRPDPDLPSQLVPRVAGRTRR